MRRSRYLVIYEVIEKGTVTSMTALGGKTNVSHSLHMLTSGVSVKPLPFRLSHRWAD